MEMNIKQAKEKISKLVDEMITKSGIEGPISDAIRADIQLGTMFLMMLEFVNVSPLSTIPNVTPDENGNLTIRIPIPEMFKGYYDMRMARMVEGEDLQEADGFTVETKQ